MGSKADHTGENDTAERGGNGSRDGIAQAQELTGVVDGEGELGAWEG